MSAVSRPARRGPSLAAIAILALGLGLATLVCSLVRTVLLQPLPFSESDRLVLVWTTDEQEGNQESATSRADFLDWRQRTTVFEDLAAFHGRRLVLGGDGPPEQVAAQRVTPTFFAVLKARPALGSFPDGTTAAAVLSHSLWVRRFAADPAVIGRTLRINGEPVVAAAVLAEDFYFPADAQIWVPEEIPAAERSDRGGRLLEVVGRLRPGVSLATARAEMSTVAARLQGEFPETNQGTGARVVELQEQMVGPLRTGLVLLMVAAGLLLLLAGVNVANLLLARTVSRQAEFAIRSVLGAAPLRLTRQLVLEGLGLSLLGGLVGMAAAGLALPPLAAASPVRLPRLEQAGLGPADVGFGGTVAVVLGLALGLVTAFRLFALGKLGDAIRESGQRSSQSRATSRLQTSLAVAQIAMAMLLLSGAGLMVRSFVELQQVDVGFDPSSTVTFGIQLPRGQYSEGLARRSFMERAEEQILRLPGVQAVGGTTTLPLEGSDIALQFVVGDRPRPAPGNEPVAGFDIVTPGYFSALRVPLVEGRFFAATDDADAKPVALVNETLSRQLWPEHGPLGASLQLLSGGEPAREIVGVVADFRHGGLTIEPRPAIFLPFAQKPQSALRLAVRSAVPPETLLPGIRREVGEIDPEVPLADVQTLEELRARDMARETFTAFLLGLFSLFGLALAALGIYSVTSFAVSRRRREIAIRMAFGADRSSVLRSVLRSGLLLAVVGLAAGLIASRFFVGLLRGLVYGVGVSDPVSGVLAASILLLAVLLASYFPARRASSIEPMAVLRLE